jgi:flavodoxin I
MKKVLVLYYSRTGNTEKMANTIAQSIQASSSIEVELNFHTNPESLSSYDALVVGAPTYHHDMPADFKNLFEDAAVKGINLKGKLAVAFGSYGWSGEAPKMILEILKNKFEMQVLEPPLLARYTPDQNSLNACKELGIKVSETLKNLS